MSNWTMGFNPEYSEQAPSLDDVKAQTDDVILEFGTPWCGYCKAAEPVVRAVLSEHPDLPHIKIYDGRGKPLGRAFRVKLWPTLILLRDGEEVARVVRPREAEKVRLLVGS